MKKMTLMQHFVEFRRRLLWCFLIFFIALILGWYVSPMLQEFFTRPLLSVWKDGSLLYSGLSDGLVIRLSLSLMVAIFVSLPAVLWHLWAFVAPGLRKQEKNFVWPFLILSPILFLVGAGFAFYILFPFVFGFFIELNQSANIPSVILPNAKDYLIFSIRLLKVFGLAFQLPLVLVLLNRMGVLPKERVVAFRRYAIVFIVVLAAVLTPPDILSQILLALPMIALFELSILFMKNK